MAGARQWASDGLAVGAVGIRATGAGAAAGAGAGGGAGAACGAGATTGRAVAVFCGWAWASRPELRPLKTTKPRMQAPRPPAQRVMGEFDWRTRGADVWPRAKTGLASLEIGVLRVIAATMGPSCA
ncbi:hypothetical protein DJ019_09955 [Phenylobacterium kunshanense]|uniref:Uncharacterized protein n=1 Tax=Phenylobacterium kunshanense TaxID=1445034 RepID=A0A328BGC2_9CAUL|nr:hypothetical protein DJ019_09955 [Phenylobacterium kunshanense]